MKLLQGKERRCCSVTHTTPFCQRSERVCDLLIWCNFMYCCFPELFFFVVLFSFLVIQNTRPAVRWYARNGKKRS